MLKEPCGGGTAGRLDRLERESMASLDGSRESSADWVAIAAQFAGSDSVIDVCPLGSGLINDTFLATLAGTAGRRFVLQRLNRHVFRQPELVMQNLRVFSAHARQRLPDLGLELGRRWEVPQVLAAKNDRDYYIDEFGSFWRAISYIDSSATIGKLETVAQAREVGCALGIFHTLSSDLDCDRLADTLEGFHIAPAYLRQFDEVLEGCELPHSSAVKYCLKFVGDRRDWVSVLEDAKAAGVLRLQTIHGDPKVNNILLDAQTGQAISLIDLDTVKPGLVHYDLGDCLRSGCKRSDSSRREFGRVRFDLDLCRGILQGYFARARAIWTEADRDYLFDAIRLIPFELGLRYIADYLAGNIYFKIGHPEQNLVRARMQFKLVESIERGEGEIRAAIEQI
ncbi:phosphotransferase enzyme family protein [Synechococcus sp. PCC 7336]|uniref:phosphotransferase enzyme family protein n=1 Tax=Synechococcus sp. PCC 7336 TaxID=195250 RepID=UPI00034D7905|nr:aminoglycoside phosphotransferase family protein [Synechococcus sp. PCC 7336]